MITQFNYNTLLDGDSEVMEKLRKCVEEVGFFTLSGTPISRPNVEEVIDTYRRFFQLPEEVKQAVNMARTGANRGWGATLSEQVNPEANPDYKQVFDCGYELPDDDPLQALELSVYAPNQWPEVPEDFEKTIVNYYEQATDVSRQVLSAIAVAIGEDVGYFADEFNCPMALLRGNYYPARPEWAGDKDFGIATHTDYGCLTLLATDGTPGLEVRLRGGGWVPVSAEPGTFIINFGEMLQMWSGNKILATPHRVVGQKQERVSVPMFFNPRFDTNVARMGSEDTILAGDHLTRRFQETYIHLKQQADPVD